MTRCSKVRLRLKGERASSWPCHLSLPGHTTPQGQKSFILALPPVPPWSHYASRAKELHPGPATCPSLVTLRLKGKRASYCSADLLLRQYKRIRNERQKAFSYKDPAPVYTIVFMETSPHIFHQFPDIYVHYVGESFNTGIELNLLQNFIFIPVDIFLSRSHNPHYDNQL